jgi:SAM-dependent methyltransferase
LEFWQNLNEFEEIVGSEKQQSNIDSVYYRDGAQRSYAMQAIKFARQKMYEMFVEKMQPNANTQILDIGVSDDENDAANFLEKNYPWQKNITCAGLGKGEKVKVRYPEITYQTIVPNEKLPFDDNSFDIACSNAVIEHVGGKIKRQKFIAEHLRVARSVFITFPNRWFPLEHHTGLPLLHFSPRLFRHTLKNTQLNYWCNPEHMDFLDRRTILAEWPAIEKPDVFNGGIPLGFFSSNVVAIYRRT